MHRMLNHMRMQAAMQRGDRVSTRMGLVDSFDPKTYSCKVRLQPEDPDDPASSLTGWLPIASMWVGNGFGVFAPPVYDQMVMVHFIEGDPDCGVVGGSMFNDVARPAQVKQGEALLLHKSGSFLKFLNDGTITTSGVLNHKGDLHVDGDITSTKDVTDKKGAMDTIRNQHNVHTHQAQGPTSPTSIPITGKMI